MIRVVDVSSFPCEVVTVGHATVVVVNALIPRICARCFESKRDGEQCERCHRFVCEACRRRGVTP